jgi:PAS domain S-box-containing protein
MLGGWANRLFHRSDPAAHPALAQETARRETAEARLRQSEGRLNILLQSRLSDALDLLDAHGNVETWNAAAVHMKGYGLAEIVGRNFSMFFTTEDAASGLPERLLAEARANGTCVCEHWCLRKDGSRFLAHRSIEAIRAGDGTLRGFASVTRDITRERIEAEQRAIIIDAAPNGMMIVDEAGLITLANAQCAQMFDYQPGALTGQPVELLLPEGSRARHAALRTEFTGGEDVHSLASGRVVSGRKRDGTQVPVEILLMPVKTPRGRIVVASIFDTTERQRREAERMQAELRERQAVEETNAWLDRLSRDLARARDRAEHANQAKSRFLASVTHELRTPLHGILGYAELMSLEGGLTATQLARLEVMTAAGQHLLAMVNSVLDMSQIEADQLELHPGPAELRALVGVCLDVVRPAADAKGLALIQAPSARLQIFADVTRLQQVLINLLGNAVKFTPSGTVQVRQASIASGASFRLEVADTGPGVRAMHREKLFKTFERLNAEAVSGIEGTGLGLAVAARLAEVMGGRIGYDDNPGGGSVFWLELPVGQGDAAAGAGEPAPEPPQGATPLRVLVADDEPLNRSIAREFLRSAGHDVVCVNDGLAAVQAASSGAFDAILMDVRMPGMNGLDATRQIRRLPPPHGQAWVIAVTAQAFAQQIETCLQAGMDSHISKPFTRSRLVAALAALPQRRPGTAEPAIQPPGAQDAAPPTAMVFDRAAIEEVAGAVPPLDLAGYLHALAASAGALRLALRVAEAPPGEALAEDAHRLAGTAGMLGFVSVAAAARAFERAIELGSADAQALADQLSHAIDAAMPVIQQERALRAG